MSGEPLSAAERRRIAADALTREDYRTPAPRARYYRCHCCGASYYTRNPHDPERDTGFGTCVVLQPLETP